MQLCRLVEFNVLAGIKDIEAGDPESDRKGEQQDELFIMAEHLPKAPGHIFYRKLNAILGEAGFDPWVEYLCRPYYAETQGRPGIPPGTYFRMLLIGYFEGIGSQRGIAWRCSDSLSLREFLGIPLTEEYAVKSKGDAYREYQRTTSAFIPWATKS